MWKKALLSTLLLIALIGSFSVLYYDYHLSAASGGYYAGGNITGRINKMPSGLTSSTGGLQKGDKILTGVTNPGHTSEKIAFQLIQNQTYTDYGCLTASTTNPETTICSKSAINAWLSATTNDVGKKTSGMTTSNLEVGKYSRSTQWGHLLYGRYVNSTTISPLMKSITDSLKSDNQLLTYRNLNPGHEFFKQIPTYFAGNANNIGLYRDFMFYTSFAISGTYNFTLDNVYLPGDADFRPLQAKDLAFRETYGLASFYHDSYTSDSYNSVGTMTSSGSFKWAGKNTLTNGYQIAIRPFAYLKLNDTVFAVSTGSSTNIGKVTQPNLPSNYSNIYSNSTGNEMKLRLENSSLNGSTKLNRIQDQTGKSIDIVVKDKTVYLDASALAGSSSKGVNTVSAIVFDSGNNFVYYKPLESAKGSGIYEFDLTGITAGKYKIGIVNEVYNESSTTPSESSAITATIPLEIVEPVSVTATPKTDLEVNKNVNQNDVVATFTTKDGISPITTTLISDTGVSGHENDYQLFSISGGNVIVNDPKGLHAGDYYFKLNAVDVNGDPIGGANSATVHIVVNKTKLSVAFDDPSQTKKSITEASTSWNETATATPNDDVKITYSVSGGDSYLINIDPDSGKITYAGSGGYGKVIIKATADDDPASGHDNYDPAFTEKEVLIFQEVDGNIIPDANSSDTTVPTFTASDANIKINGIIATIQGTLGSPDTIGGTTTTYTYGLKSGVDDASLFAVDANSGVIKTTANLGVKSYHITVTVSDKWSTKEIPVTIHVGLAGAEDLKFYENSTSNTIITTKSVKVTDSGVSVFAEVKGSTNNNPVTYKIKDGSSHIITVHPNSGAITIHGTGTVIIVAEKKGATGQADAQTELSFTVTAGEQDFIYTDASKNKLPQTGNRYNEYKETYAPSKTFQLYTDGNPAGSTVTYRLKAGSPNDVITVDASGLVHIVNASMNTQIGKVIVEATSHDPSGNYSDKTIELPITIEQGTRTIAFAEDPIYVVNGSGSIVPNILTDGILDTDNDITIEVDSGESSIAWTNDGITIEYSWNDANGKDIAIHAIKQEDRNYKVAETDGILHILGADEKALSLSTPGRIIYGDHFVIKSTQNDSMSKNVQYTFETDNGVFISAPQVSGNKAEFDALANSGNTQIKIKVTRTADGEMPLSKTVTIKVLPKPITIQIDDKEKKRLEENPPLTFQDFTSQLVSWGGVRDTIDTSHIKLSTTAKKYSPIGSYPITSDDAQKQLNDNYPNYTFTIKQGLLNVIDNGNKDFWDIDDDGCPDLNIKLTDDDGNEITINGDKNDDGIPDYNIDTNGDGKPDLNIDTDKDGSGDINLVMLKEWKPSKCITMGDIQYSSGINAKAEINIDLNGDMVPDIDIDNKGDFKPHLNISKDGKTPFVNIAEMHTWEPIKDYKKDTFLYDSIGKDQEEYKPTLNIDSDDDGRPDINIDLDGDGEADINIDIDLDGIPDIDIDSDGDGKPDINIDTNGDGKPDENIREITEWKPEHNVDEPFGYDTMSFDDNEVSGSYYPGDNVGGALTGDDTNIMIYLYMSIISILMFSIMYSYYKKE